MITIDGVPYKGVPPQMRMTNTKSGMDSTPPPACRNKRRDTLRSVFSDGFMTPPSESSGEHDESNEIREDFVEWARFAPSFPYMSDPVVSNQPANTGSSSPCGPGYWLRCDASNFDVRNIRYRQTQEKVPSEFALYECVGMDMIRDQRRIDFVLDRFHDGDLPQSLVGAREWEAGWGVPRVLVINCQVPYTAGRLLGAHPEEDGGFSILNYFVLSHQASECLAQGTLTPALRLLKRFVEDGKSTKDGVALKVAGRVEDLDKYEVPESFKRFNNKPVLLAKSASVYSSRLPEVMEIDFDIRMWNYPARGAIASYHHRAKDAECSVGYLLEGKVDEELPEQILGCFTVKDMDIMAARWT